MNALTKLTKARTQLLIKNPFMSLLVLRLALEESPIHTMATDGRNIVYDPKFVEKLSMEHLKGVIVHEVMHCMFFHPFRRGNRDRKLWNIACDYAVNLIITEDLGMFLPEDALCDVRYRGMTAEAIYNQLLSESNPDSGSGSGSNSNPNSGSIGQCPWGQIEDAEGSKEEIQQLEAAWQMASEEAATTAKMAGNLPKSLEELVKKAQAKINWREQLARIIGGISKTDYAWYPPDIQYIQHKLHIPTLNAPSIGHLVLALDTSASVSSDEIGQFFGELQYIVDNVKAERFTVIQCDTKISHIEEPEALDDLKPHIYARGGTRFEPVFEWCEDQQVDALLYLTDMEPMYWPDKPDYPVHWVRTADIDAPYGSHIDLFRGDQT